MLYLLLFSLTLFNRDHTGHQYSLEYYLFIFQLLIFLLLYTLNNHLHSSVLILISFDIFLFLHLFSICIHGPFTYLLRFHLLNHNHKYLFTIPFCIRYLLWKHLSNNDWNKYHFYFHYSRIFLCIWYIFDQELSYLQTSSFLGLQQSKHICLSFFLWPWNPGSNNSYLRYHFDPYYIFFF